MPYSKTRQLYHKQDTVVPEKIFPLTGGNDTCILERKFYSEPEVLNSNERGGVRAAYRRNWRKSSKKVLDYEA